MASTKGDPARDPKPFVNPYKNLDLPPEAFTFGKSVSLTVFVSGSFVVQYCVGTLFVSICLYSTPFSMSIARRSLPQNHGAQWPDIVFIVFFVIRSLPRLRWDYPTVGDQICMAAISCLRYIRSMSSPSPASFFYNYLSSFLAKSLPHFSQ